MDFRDLGDPDARMEELSRRIAELPKGTISVKTINGKKRYYHQWYEGGRTCGRYIRQSELGKLEELRSQIEERRRCEEELKGIVSWLDGTVDFRGFRTSVVAGTGLLRMAQESKGLERRDCYGKLVDYLHGSSPSVCVLYGLRRTGKTTMIYQAIMDMSGDELRRTAYIALGSDNRVRDLYLDIQRLIENGYTTFFLDEVTLMPDFIRSAGVLSVVFSSQGARLVMLGTDSLGFWLAGDDELYGRITMVHTTQIPYREHSRLLGIASIDDYIRYGGTLRKGEIDLEDPFRVLDDIPFEELSTASRYCDRAIAHNIQNSLVRLEDSGHFAPLMDLRRAQVLTGTINRVVDDIIHRFAVDVIDRAFRSNILDDAARNLAGDGRSDLRDDILMRIDTDAVVARLKESLSVKDPGESDIRISDGGLSTLREYLRAMDVISSYDVVHLHVDGGVDEYEQTIVTQPGMRFCHAQALICSLRRDEEFAEADERRRDAVERRIMDTLFGRMISSWTIEFSA